MPMSAMLLLHVGSSPVSNLQCHDFKEHGGDDGQGKALGKGIDAGPAKGKVPVVPDIHIHALCRSIGQIIPDLLFCLGLAHTGEERTAVDNGEGILILVHHGGSHQEAGAVCIARHLHHLVVVIRQKLYIVFGTFETLEKSMEGQVDENFRDLRQTWESYKGQLKKISALADNRQTAQTSAMLDRSAEAFEELDSGLAVVIDARKDFINEETKASNAAYDRTRSILIFSLLLVILLSGFMAYRCVIM